MDGLQFNNPIEIQAKETVEITQDELDQMGVPVDAEESPQEIIPEEIIEIVQEPSVETQSNESEINTDSVAEVPQEMLENYIPEVANFLFEKGILKHLPEGVDPEAFDQEALLNTLAYNKELEGQQLWQQATQTVHENIANKISPLTSQLLRYNLDNPNADDEDIQGFLKSVFESNFVTQLDPKENAEQLVREYYEKVMNWDKTEVDKEIANLIEREDLGERAEFLKPKLESHVTSITKEKEQKARIVAQELAQLDRHVETKLYSHLEKGKLFNMDLTREQGVFLSQAILNNEIPVNVRGKKVNMGYAEALVMQKKYSNQPEDFQNLMLGLLVMQEGPKAFDKFIKLQARTEETEKVIKQHKFSNTKKKSGVKNQNSYESTGINFKNFIDAK